MISFLVRMATEGMIEIPGLEGPVLESVRRHVVGRPDREVGGFLIGHRDDVSIARVTTALPATGTRETVARLTFTHETWTRVHDVLERDHPEASIVGWYHSHPGHGIFLSGHDLFIHRHFFAHPAQIALVIDPVERAEGAFGWHDGHILPLFERRLPPATPGEPCS